MQKRGRVTKSLAYAQSVVPASVQVSGRYLVLCLLFGYMAFGVPLGAQLTLPYSGTDSSSTAYAFQITKSGSGGATKFVVSNEGTSGQAMYCETAGSGIAVYGFASKATGATTGVYGRASSTTGRGVVGVATATSGVNYGGIFESSSSSGYGLYVSNIAGGTSLRSVSSSGVAVYGSSTATSGVTYAGRFQSASTSGVGVYGYASATSGTTYGLYGESVSPAGTGVYGYGSATDGSATGVYGQSDGSSGYGVYGYGSATDGSATGVYGESVSPAGTGVYGYASATTGPAWGLCGMSDSTSGRGVVGIVNADSGTIYGVIGGCDTSPTGYGVYSAGNFAVTGTKSFQIDHPLQPETHYLNHFCTEGPEPYNVYRGNVVTDTQGYATITLPAYFESINRDPTYHLTIVDGAGEEFVLVRVVRVIQNNQFVIRTSKPFVKVSWRVEAIRNDRWVQRHGFQTEQEKPAEHQGKYLHPKLYGEPKENGIHYRPVREPTRNKMNKP